jgi:hypothetical protein
MGAGCEIKLPSSLAQPLSPAPTRRVNSGDRGSTPRASNAGDRESMAVRQSIEFFADAAHGDDSAAGTETAPFKTVERAVEAVRKEGQQGGTVTLRAGVFYMPKTLMLTAADSGLVIRTNASTSNTLVIEH